MRCNHKTVLNIDGGGWYCPACNSAVFACDECGGDGCDKCKRTGWLKVAAPSKMHNRKVWVGEVKRWMDSQAEADRFYELYALREDGLIERLECQRTIQLRPPFRSRVTGEMVKAIDYRADFVYFDPGRGVWIVEDVKGHRTKDYEIKRKLFLAMLETPEWSDYIFEEIKVNGKQPKYNRNHRRAA